MKNVAKKERNTTVVDMLNGKIYITKAFYKKSVNPMNPECAELARLMREHKGFSIELKETNKKTYANLTYEKMEEYIGTQANSEAMLKEFEEVKKVAKAKNQAYAATKKWFFKNYPEYKEDGVCDKELGKNTNTINEDVKRTADELINNIIPLKKAVNE